MQILVLGKNYIDDNMNSAWIKKYDALITKKPAAYFTKPAWKNKWCYQGDNT